MFTGPLGAGCWGAKEDSIFISFKHLFYILFHLPTWVGHGVVVVVVVHGIVLLWLELLLVLDGAVLVA